MFGRAASAARESAALASSTVKSEAARSSRGMMGKGSGFIMRERYAVETALAIPVGTRRRLFVVDRVDRGLEKLPVKARRAFLALAFATLLTGAFAAEPKPESQFTTTDPKKVKVLEDSA